MSITTLGECWHAALFGTSDTEYADANALDRAALQNATEAKAALTEIKAETVPAGIASCIARNSPSLTIEMSATLTGDAACLAELETWLRAERLAFAIVDLNGKPALGIAPRAAPSK